MARCRPYSFLLSLNPPDHIARDANSSWGVPDVFYNPQDLNSFLPQSTTAWEPPLSTEPAQPVVTQPQGCPRGGGATVEPPQDLLQQCLTAAGITEQLLEAEAKQDPGTCQPPMAPCSVPQSFPKGAQPALGQQPLLAMASSAQPFVEPLATFSCLPVAMAAQLGGQQVMATALPVPQLMFLQQVPQRIILQVKQPGATSLTCVQGSGQGPGSPAHKATGHPHSATLSPCGHPGAAAPQHSSVPTPKDVGIELWHGESFWGLEPNWGKLDSFISYF